MEEKPKRTLSPEALKKLQLAREKALEAKRQNKEITKYEKETSRKEKQQRREQTYNAIIELKQKEEETKEQPKKVIKPKIVEPEPEPEEEEPDEGEEEEEEIIKVPSKKVIAKAPITQVTPPKQFKKKTTIPAPRREATNEELYDNANIEILRHRLYQQTRQRLQNDLFGY